MKQEFESSHLAKQLNINQNKFTMEDILKALMGAKCVSMHNNQFRCYGKGCDGQCALFQATLITLRETTTKQVQAVVNDLQLYNAASEYEEETL